jgi:3-hydroxyacyl-CoA dehydrogenase
METASATAPRSFPLLRRAAVLGAGAMGSRIAAHLANAGLPVVLLDRVAPGKQGDGTSKTRSSLAANAVAGLLKAKPASFYDASAAALITIGNFEDDLELLKDCDWVIEAVAEDLGIKQGLLASIEPYIRSGKVRAGSAAAGSARAGDGRMRQGEAAAIVTTNTSGLPVAKIAEKMSPEFRRRWFGTHFFNPPRYMRLLEIIPTTDSDSAAVAAIAYFAERRLGKAVVYARDTPNFIANRVGVFAMLTALDLMQRQGLTVEEVDALTGSVIGWPRMGTFRLTDMVGIDVLAHVARNFAGSRSDDASLIALPAFVETMLERGWTGDKAGQGFYKKAVDKEGGRLTLDWRTLEYRPAERPKFPTVEMAKNAESIAEHLRLLLSGDTKKDKAAAFLFPLLTSLWNYAADVLPEIADSPATIDQAMRMGFNWELGPFAMWDAAGVAETIARQRTGGMHVSPQGEALLASGRTAWYGDAGVFDPVTGSYQLQPEVNAASAASFRHAGDVIRENSGCALLDMGEGIALLELRSKKNAIGDDIISLVSQTLNADGESVRNFRGFVIGGDATDFSVGANLMQLLLSMQEGEWDEVDFAVRGFQRMTAAIKFCPRPLVVAPFHLCLGGGAEICLHAAARQAHAELYIGLVEASVGLVPAGGGSKEMALRAVDAAQASTGLDPTAERFARSADLQDALRRRFETMAMAKVSTSAAEAKALGLLKAGDGITLNRDRLLLDAREEAMRLAEAGYAPPAGRTVAAAGSGVLATLKVGIDHMRKGEYISEHDAKVAGCIAHILCGGEVTQGAPVSEKYFLELEREAFLSLCGERKTQERIAYTLRNGKPLRN